MLSWARPVFQRRNGGRLLVGPNALSSMLAGRQESDQRPESGGILLGRLIIDTTDVVIDEATMPQQGDTQTCKTFHRRSEATQRLVDTAWKASQGTRVYLGEWHTHAESKPRPSRVDRKNRTRILRSARFGQGFLFFVIIGFEEMRVWEGTPNGPRRPQELKQLTE